MKGIFIKVDGGHMSEMSLAETLAEIDRLYDPANKDTPRGKIEAVFMRELQKLIVGAQMETEAFKIGGAKQNDATDAIFYVLGEAFAQYAALALGTNTVCCMSHLLEGFQHRVELSIEGLVAAKDQYSGKDQSRH